LLRRKIKTFNYYMQFVSGFTLVTMMLLTVADVIMRGAFNKPILGVYELTCLFLTFIVFFAVGYAQDYKEHVVIDVLYDLLPLKGQRIISYLSSIMYLAMVTLVCWVVFKYGLSLIPTNATTAVLKIPHWPVVIFSSIGLVGYIFSIIGDLLFLKEGGVLRNDTD